MVIDTAKALLLPAEMYESGAEAGFLRFNGIALSSDEVAVASNEQDGIVAVMAMSAVEWSLLERERDKGKDISVTSPLLSIATGRNGRDGKRVRAVELFMTIENLYIAVWDKGLCMAEALPDNSVDSILYYMQVLGRRFKLRKFEVNVSGSGAAEVAEVLRHYYGHVNTI